LLVAGAGFTHIRQYALAHGWGVSDRQVRRYIEIAHQKMAKEADRSCQQLRGLHLRKMRDLYAKSVKANDSRMTLQVLREEAKLQGLYPSTKTEAETEATNGQPTGPCHPTTTISIRERAALYVKAELQHDQTVLRLLEESSNYSSRQIADIHVATHLLGTMTTLYVKEQIGYAMGYFYAKCQDMVTNRSLPAWGLSMQLLAYRFWANREGWDRFGDSLGVKGDDLVAIYANDPALAHCQTMLCLMAPSAEDLLADAKVAGLQEPKLIPSPNTTLCELYSLALSL